MLEEGWFLCSSRSSRAVPVTSRLDSAVVLAWLLVMILVMWCLCLHLAACGLGCLCLMASNWIMCEMLDYEQQFH